MRLEHHLVGGYVHYISPHIIIIIKAYGGEFLHAQSDTQLFSLDKINIKNMKKI